MKDPGHFLVSIFENKEFNFFHNPLHKFYNLPRQLHSLLILSKAFGELRWNVLKLHRKPTWLRSISPPSLGSYTVIPPSVGVLDKSPHILEELTEGHLASLIDSVIKKGSPPQEGVFSEQDTMNTRQAFLGRVDWL